MPLASLVWVGDLAFRRGRLLTRWETCRHLSVPFRFGTTPIALPLPVRLRVAEGLPEGLNRLGEFEGRVQI